MRLSFALLFLMLIGGPAPPNSAPTTRRRSTASRRISTASAPSRRGSFRSPTTAGWRKGASTCSAPGKMRIEYKPPVPLILVATGKLIILYDRKLDQTTHLPLAASPASWLLGERLTIRDKIQVTEVRQTGGRVYLSLVQKGEAAKGTLHLVFLDSPCACANGSSSTPSAAAPRSCSSTPARAASSIRASSFSNGPAARAARTSTGADGRAAGGERADEQSRKIPFGAPSVPIFNAGVRRVRERLPKRRSHG